MLSGASYLIIILDICSYCSIKKDVQGPGLQTFLKVSSTISGSRFTLVKYFVTRVLQKSFVTGFGLLQCYVLSKIFLLQTFKVFPPLLKHIFVTFLPSHEKQINSRLLVSVGDTDK